MNRNETWQRERVMAPAGYRRAIAQLGLSIAQAGRWLGVSKRTGYRYANGETDIPPVVVLLLRAAIEHRIRPLVPSRGTPPP
jgi:hypothetical protein